MNENFDILPEGAADAFERYLNMVKDRLDTLMAQTNSLNFNLEDHDRNAFTEKIQGSIGALAGQVQGMADGIGEITHKLLMELEEKNDRVNSSVQADYIGQLHAAAGRLSEIETYREAELGGRKSFSEEEKDGLSLDLRDLTDEWEDAVRQMARQAQELNNENEQNELSGVYAEISGLFDQFLNRMGEQIEAFGSHLEDVEDSYQGRKGRMNAAAAEDAEGFLAQLNRQLEDSTGEFTGFSF